MQINLFKISKAWFELSFEDHRITPTHTTLIFYCIDLNNRLAWVDNFGLPAIETSQALNISYNTFRKVLKELVEFGHIKIIKKSTNQYTANIISLNLLYQNLLKQRKSKLKASLKQSDITKPIKHIKPINTIPTYLNFKTYAFSKKYNIDELSLKFKYDAWIENGWKDGFDKPIKNWKSKLLNTIPYLKESIKSNGEVKNHKVIFNGGKTEFYAKDKFIEFVKNRYAPEQYKLTII